MSSIVGAVGGIFGAVRTETPKFSVVKQYATFELRQYERQIRAIVEYESTGTVADGLNNPFRALAGYIFGGNEKAGSGGGNEKVAMTAPVVTQHSAPSEKIAMTAPVVTQTSVASSSKRVMAFILPDKYKSIDELPRPKNADVKFEEVPPTKVVAIKFNGRMKDRVESKEAELRQAAAEANLLLSTTPEDVQYCQYNPPWCLPFARTNEILIPVKN